MIQIALYCLMSHCSSIFFHGNVKRISLLLLALVTLSRLNCPVCITNPVIYIIPTIFTDAWVLIVKVLTLTETI